MKKNSTPTKETVRWRCKDPNFRTSATHRRLDQAQTRDFKTFYTYATGTASLTEVAGTLYVSQRTFDRRFISLRLIDVPNISAPDRIYGQILIDDTYTAAGCLLVATSRDHVIACQRHRPPAIRKHPPNAWYSCGHYF